MNFRLIETGWDAEFTNAAKHCRSTLRIVTPFLQSDAVERLLINRPKDVSVITRFCLDEFFSRVSSLEALSILLNAGAKIKGVSHLHAKAYLFDDRAAIITSANLTNAALLRNLELGVVVGEPEMVAECSRYFDRLWDCAGPLLTRAWLKSMETKVNHARAHNLNVASTGLGDEGTYVGYGPAVSVLPSGFVLGAQAFVKFSGVGDDREDVSANVLEEVESSGMHWACCYPTGRAPRAPQEGDTMFLSRLTYSTEGNDIVVYGRAVVRRAHNDVRDIANAAEKTLRPWKNKWSRYILVHGAQFVAGTLANGISLGALMDTLGPFAFASTERRALGGETEVSARASLRQKAAVHLSDRGKVLLNGQLETAFARHGTLSEAELATLDWPTRA